MSLTIFCLIILSGLLHASWNTLAKYVGKNTAILWLSMSLGGWLGIPYLIWIQSTINWPLLLFWGLISAITHALYYITLTHSYAHFSLSTIYPISRGLGITITSFVSFFYFNDLLTFFGLLGIAFVLMGIIIFHHSHTNASVPAQGIRWGILVGITIASYLVTDYLALQYIPVDQLVWVIFIFMSIILFPYLYYFRRADLQETLAHKKGIAILIGCLSFLSYFLILWVLRTSPLGYVVALRETSIIFAGFLAWAFLKESFSIKKCFAIFFLCLGAIIIKIS